MKPIAAQFFAFDDRLHALGEPPCSPYWREHVTRFLDAFEQGTAIEFWSCVGRGGSKSTVLYKLLTFFALFGKFTIPPAQRHYATLISKNKIEAGKGLAIIENWLTALREPYSTLGDAINLTNINRGVRVVSASVGAASGWRSFALALDEQAKWSREGEQLQLDADEVMASAKAMLATHANAPVMVASTPWIDEGSFFEAITKGDGNHRIVCGPTPSWIANPDLIDEATTRKREPNRRVHDREYGAMFVPAFEDGFFDVELLDRATDVGRWGNSQRGPVPSGYVMCIDPAFRGDQWAIAVAHCERRGTGGMVILDHISVIQPPRGGGVIDPEFAISETARIRRQFPGDRTIRSDQHQAEGLRFMFLKHNIHLIIEPETMQSKIETYTLVRNLLAAGRVRLPDEKALRNELAAVGIRRTPAGNEKISTRSRHDDRASAFVHVVYVAHQSAPYMMTGTSMPVPYTVGPRRLDLDATGSVIRDGMPSVIAGRRGDPVTVEDAIKESMRRDGR